MTAKRLRELWFDLFIRLVWEALPASQKRRLLGARVPLSPRSSRWYGPCLLRDTDVRKRGLVVVWREGRASRSSEASLRRLGLIDDLRWGRSSLTVTGVEVFLYGRRQVSA
jgi:hypothetical protein